MKKRAPAKKAAGRKPAAKKSAPEQPAAKKSAPKKPAATAPVSGANDRVARRLTRKPPAEPARIGWPAFRYPPE